MIFLVTIISIISSFSVLSQDFSVSNTVNQKPVDPVYLSQYKIADRNQRVRFFMSSQDNTKKYIAGSKQIEGMKKDPVLSNFMTSFAGRATSAHDSGLSEFSEKSDWLGLVVNPRLIMCAADLLRIVEKIGNRNADIFADWKIDEVNLFLYPTVSTDNYNYYKLNISPVAQVPDDPALNVQIPYFVDTDMCALPTAEKLEAALINASNE